MSQFVVKIVPCKDCGVILTIKDYPIGNRFQIAILCDWCLDKRVAKVKNERELCQTD